MASIKIILRKQANKDGTHPLAIQIIKNRKNSILHVGHSVLEKDWDPVSQHVKKSYPNSARLNNLLLKKRAEAHDKLLDLEAKDQDISSLVIKKQIKRKGGVSFFEQADIFLKNLKDNGKYGRYTTDVGRIKFFKEFLGRDITFPEITVSLLNQFRAWLKANRGIGERTIINYLMLIRTIYNQAIKSHVTDNKTYPFGNGKIVIKFPDSIKVGWNVEEVRKLESMELTGYQNHARNLWLLSLYFAGMRLSDLMRLRWSDFKDGRLQYGMTKNTKVDSLKVPEKVSAILEKYRNDPQKHDLVFPELKVLDVWDEYEVKKKIAFAGKRMAKELKKMAKVAGIDKNISAHISRHTFGNIAGDKIPIQVLQHLYRHASISTTIGYQQNFIHKETDHALDSVLNF